MHLHARRRPATRAAVAAVGLVVALAGSSCSNDDTSSADRSRTTTTTVAPGPAASTVAQLLALGRPVVLAHAGGENASPHSTPYAYERAVAAGVDMLDFDVQLSKDGVLVVQHDETVDRTTDGTGKVADMTYAELSKLDNAYWFTDTCTCTGKPEADYTLRGMRTGAKAPPKGNTRDDFIIARFEDIAAKYPGYPLNIEVKGKYPDNVPAAKELARVLKKLGREDAAVVTAFDDQLAEAFHQEAPSVAITPGLSATTQYVLNGVKPADGRTILQIPPDYETTHVLTPELVAKAHADGLQLWIWPNEDKWENVAGYTQLLDMGVDGLNAARPEQAVEALKAWKPKQ